MLAWMDAEALRATLETGEVHFHSPIARPALAQGRDERQRAAARRPCRRLRRRRAAGHGRPGRPDLPPRHAELLRPRRRGGGRRAARGRRRRRSARRRDVAAAVGAAADGPAAVDGPAASRSPGLRLARVALGDDRIARCGAARGLVHGLAAGRRRRCRRPQGHRGGDRGPDGGQGRRPAEAVGRCTCRDPPALAGEAADLLYHALVLLAQRGVPPAAVVDVLRSRHAGEQRPSVAPWPTRLPAGVRSRGSCRRAFVARQGVERFPSDATQAVTRHRMARNPCESVRACDPIRPESVSDAPSNGHLSRIR